MFQKIKDQLSNIRRHYKLFAVLVILLFICFKMFQSNYKLQMPFIKIDNYINNQENQNDLAACLTNLQAMQNARDAMNADIMK